LRALAIACLALLAGDALAEPVDVCLVAMKDGQVLRDHGSLRAARDSFLRCAEPSCPEIVTRKCSAWRDEVAALVPVLVVAVPVAGAQLFVDGAPQSIGAAVEVDPGEHSVRVVDGDRSETRSVTLAPGERRELQVDFPAPLVLPAPPPAPLPSVAPPPRPVVVAEPEASAAWPIAITAFALGGAALIVGTVAGAVTVARAGDLEARCESADGCPQSDIDEARVVAHVSTAGFVIAGVAGAAGVIAAVIAQSDDASLALRVGPGSAAVTLSF
jgi:hypothetical protein